MANDNQSRSCRSCGIPVPVRQGGPKYCSDLCRYMGQHRNVSWKIEYLDCQADGCDRCWIRPTRGSYAGRRKLDPRHRQGRFCSDWCEKRARVEAYKRKQELSQKPCAWCFTIHRRWSSKYCSQDCQAAAKRHWGQHHHPSLCHLPMCITCGERTLKRPHLGSPECDNCGGHDAAHANRRRAVRRGEKFTIRDLVDRDGDSCSHCGEPVAMAGDHNGPEYATIDHIVPLIAGGEHTMANCQVMHRRCNTMLGAKGNRHAARLEAVAAW